MAIGEDAETGSDAVVLIAGAGEQAPSAPVLKQGPRLASKKVVPPHKVVSSGTVGRVIERAVAPPVAHPETDFRNVRILNAAPGEGTIYRHLR